MKTFYSDKYFAETPTASMRKLPKILESISGLRGIEIVKHSLLFEAIPLLIELHGSDYVEAFLHGKRPHCNSNGWNWTQEIKNGVFSMNAAQISAAKVAFSEKISCNLAQGFHHSSPNPINGMGYCTFNGLALVAQAFKDKTICVLDCDEHQGNGTGMFTETLTNLHNFSIYGTSFGDDAKNERNHYFQVSNEREYLKALDISIDGIKKIMPDLVIYQAGVDPHENDPLCSWGASESFLYERDRFVFKTLCDSGINTMFVMAGGYQEMDSLVKLHTNTFKAATEIYNN